MAKKVTDFMTKNVAFCTPDTRLEEVARKMVENDCGLIPVFESERTRIPVGTVTDRDITCRIVAQGKNPLEFTALDCMTTSPATISADSSLDDCLDVMENNQIRRVLVVDQDGCCCGIVAQADIARHGDKKKTGEVVQEVSQPA